MDFIHVALHAAGSLWDDRFIFCFSSAAPIPSILWLFIVVVASSSSLPCTKLDQVKTYPPPCCMDPLIPLQS